MDTKIVDEDGAIVPGSDTPELKPISSVEESVDEIFDVCNESEVTNGHNVEEEENANCGSNDPDEFMNKMTQLTREKGDSSELVLEDVKLEENFKEMNLNEEEDTEVANSEVAEETIPQSKSLEFTYTTFGSPERTDSSDESAPRVEPDPVMQDVNEDVMKPTAMVGVKQTENEVAKNKESKNNNDVNNANKKPGMDIDEFIDEVKQNRVSNKDACNYMLNLLVSGEFDLEKNFIIQNVNNILNLIQVIKCAQPSLKVGSFLSKFFRNRIDLLIGIN
jgi:hypothetical protein